MMARLPSVPAALPANLSIPDGAGLVLGADIGGTQLRVALAGTDGQPLARASAPVARSRSALCGQLLRLAANAQQDLVRARPTRAGCPIVQAVVGCPAIVQPDQTLAQSPNLPALEGEGLAQALAQGLGCPVQLENDVNLAALAEARCDRQAGSLAFIAIGTGLGMGVVLDGQLWRGAQGAAGEISHLPFGTGIDPCSEAARRQGALECSVSGQALARRLREWLPDESSCTPERLFELAAQGRARAQQALDEFFLDTARAVAAVCAVLDPDQVVLGGGLGMRPETLQWVRAHLPLLMNRPAPLRASLLGTEAGLRGALLLALDLHRCTHPEAEHA